jgi:hypothetical protein
VFGAPCEHLGKPAAEKAAGSGDQGSHTAPGAAALLKVDMQARFNRPVQIISWFR